MFAREGYPFILGAALLAAMTFAMALRMRSWQLWLIAFVLTIIALWVAWFFRDPARGGERAANVAVAPANGRMLRNTNIDERLGSRVHLFLPTDAKLRVAVGERIVAGQTVIAHLAVT